MSCVNLPGILDSEALILYVQLHNTRLISLRQDCPLTSGGHLDTYAISHQISPSQAPEFHPASHPVALYLRTHS